jgi:DASS family divalent anion:Na+ symporter
MTEAGGGRRMLAARAAVAILALTLWFTPPPEGLSLPAWHLFALFAAAIVSVVLGALPILTASLVAVALAVLTGTLPPAAAYAGFSNKTILLIVVAFLVARAVVTCGLGQRVGYAVVALFGRSTLGLAYSLFLVDAVIAPAFPSNTARSGVLFPLAFSLTEITGAKPGETARRRLGAFLMFSGIASLSVSSALWFTAMAANSLGAEIVRPFGVEISFGSWLAASVAPTLAAMVVLPALLYVLFRPEVQKTPEAPAAARKSLAELGRMSGREWIVTATFVGMVILWALGGTLDLDATAVAIAGFAVLLMTGALTLADIAKQGDVLEIYLWFAILFALSSQLNELGFMGYLGQRLAARLDGFAPWVAGLVLVVAYVALHYLFVSQTAHLLALLGVFLDVGVRLGVRAAPLAFLLLFSTNFFSALTPQASSANLLFAGSGHLMQGEMYRIGAIATACCLVIYLVVGTPWLLWVTG